MGPNRSVAGAQHLTQKANPLLNVLRADRAVPNGKSLGHRILCSIATEGLQAQTPCRALGQHCVNASPALVVNAQMQTCDRRCRYPCTTAVVGERIQQDLAPLRVHAVHFAHVSAEMAFGHEGRECFLHVGGRKRIR